MTMTDERLAELDAVMAKATVAFPITSRDTVDYAEITFGSSQTQAMSMEPETLLAINDVFAAVPDLRAHIEAQDATIARLRRCLLPVQMLMAQAECVDEPLSDSAVVLSFMGSGASDQVTAGEVRAALAGAA